ncbi:MAG TPA: hypothetical protein VI589_07880, partial [Vicinamibacteria bacterium]
MSSPTRRFASLLLLSLASLAAAPASLEPLPRTCGTHPRGSLHALALHRHFAQERARRPDPLQEHDAPRDHDRGHVAVLVDRGDLVARRNPWDLDGATLRFVPHSDSGYSLLRLGTDREPAGGPLEVPAGGTVLVELTFDFPFYGRAQRRVFVHADGTLTFGQPGQGAQPGLPDLLAGPPRVAACFAAFDPSRGGVITARLQADRAIFDWRDLPGAGQVNRNSCQAVLSATGEIDLVFGTLEVPEVVVGLSPGQALESVAVDLSAPEPTRTTGAFAERFSEAEKADLVAIARRFYRSHPDVFEQLVVYTTRPLNPFPDTLAFELNVKNEVLGIGLETRDDAMDYGSALSLRSVVYMDGIDPYLEADGLELLGHEVGHRWLSRLLFRREALPQGALLGRGGVHWSFFLDSDASVMEGNDIADRGGGRFETVGIAHGFSALDQYAMGLRAAAEVEAFFYVEAPDDFRPNRPYKAGTGPEPGVSFTGIRRDVRIEDVVAAVGPRAPSADEAPRVLRQAFILVADERALAT